MKKEDRKTLNDAAQRALDIIETADARLLATDGPIGDQVPPLTLAEWTEVYRLIRRIRNATI